MPELLIDNIFVIFGGRVFQDSWHIYGCKLCSSSHRLVPLFVRGRLHTGLLKKNKKKLVRSFNFTFRYIDDVLSINNSRFGDFVDRIYHIELEIKDTTNTDRFASYLEIDSEGRLRTKLYNKRDVYIFQLIRYSRACGSYQDFLDRGLLLTRKLLNQRFLLVKLKSSIQKFYDRHHDLVDRYGISVSQMITNMPYLS
jgi:hypothetical protein